MLPPIERPVTEQQAKEISPQPSRTHSRTDFGTVLKKRATLGKAFMYHLAIHNGTIRVIVVGLGHLRKQHFTFIEYENEMKALLEKTDIRFIVFKGNEKIN